METVKIPYICGALTELPLEIQPVVKQLYSDLADVCLRVIKVRAFVPHEHCDPVKHANLEPPEVDAVERPQICERTSLLVVVAIAPSWGGGIEVEMAFRSQVPVVILIPKGKRVSRLLRGNPGVVMAEEYDGDADALKLLESILMSMSDWPFNPI